MFYDSLCHGGFSCHRSSTNEKQQWFRQFMLDLFFLVWYCMSFSTYFCASLINVFWSRVQTVLGFCRWEGALFSAECGKWESPNLFVGELVGCFPTKIYWFHCCASREMKESHKHVHYFLCQFFWKHYSGCLVSFLLFSYFVLMPHSRAVTKNGDKRSLLQRNFGKYGGHLFWCIWISHTVWSFFTGSLPHWSAMFWAGQPRQSWSWNLEQHWWRRHNVCFLQLHDPITEGFPRNIRRKVGVAIPLAENR